MNSQDDLFQPTLDDSHDVAGIKAPWNPTRLMILTFFFGSIAALILFSMNACKLGMKKSVPWIIATCLFCYFGWAGSYYMLYNHLMEESLAEDPLTYDEPATEAGEIHLKPMPIGAERTSEEVAEDERAAEALNESMLAIERALRKNEVKDHDYMEYFKYGSRGLMLLLVFLAARPQWNRHDIADTHGIPDGRLWPMAILSAVVGLGAYFGAAFTLVMILT